MLVTSSDPYHMAIIVPKILRLSPTNSQSEGRKRAEQTVYMVIDDYKRTQDEDLKSIVYHDNIRQQVKSQCG